MNEQSENDKSLDLIQKAMKDVKAEFLITLEDESTHIVYITKFEIVDNKVIYDACTPSVDRFEELGPHIETIFKKIMNDMTETTSKNTKLLSF